MTKLSQRPRPNTRGSVRLKKIGWYEVRLSDDNKIFVMRGANASFPTMNGSTNVKFDDPAFDKCPKNVLAYVRDLINKQRSVRLRIDREASIDEFVMEQSGLLAPMDERPRGWLPRPGTRE